MGDGDDVGQDHGDEGGQQEDNERVDVTTLGQLSGKFGTTFRQVWETLRRWSRGGQRAAQ